MNPEPSAVYTVGAWANPHDTGSVLDAGFLAAWAGRLGPTATLLAIYLAHRMSGLPITSTSDAELADHLGVHPKKIRAAWDRLIHRGLAEVSGSGVVAVRLTYPPAPRPRPAVLERGRP